MHLTVPDKNDAYVKELVKMICPDSKVINVPVLPVVGAEVSQCFPTVDKKIEQENGSRVLGWQIWKTPNIAEAEFHAVWRSPDDYLIDITPKHFEINKILFLPDPTTEYKGCQVDSVRLNISGNKLVDDLIEIKKAEFRLLNKGERAKEHLVSFSGQDLKCLETLKEIMAGVSLMIQQNLDQRSLCFCGNSKKYRHCHGKKLTKLLKKI
jgi:hypothetical protein